VSTLNTAAIASLGLIALWLIANLGWVLLALYRTRRDYAQGRPRDQCAATVIYLQRAKDLRRLNRIYPRDKVVKSPAALGGDNQRPQERVRRGAKPASTYVNEPHY
jgi:hypothetical protein